MSLRKNGSAEAMKEEKEKQRDTKLHSQNLNLAAQGGSFGLNQDRDVLRELISTSLTEGQQDLLENLLSQDFVLANYTEAELQELRWDLETIQDMFFATHPSQECVVTGEFRAYCYDDPDETAEPLTEKEKLEVIQYFKGVRSRLTRAREMKQQEMMAKQIQESHMVKNENEDGGGIVGRIRG